MKNIKPSKLIELALKDLETVESMPEIYEISMNVFHENHNKKCFICLAGAVMAITLHADKNKTLNTGYFPEQQHLLRALNMFRVGAIESGFLEMGIPLNNLKSSLYVTPYHINPIQFKIDMKNMTFYLKENNL
ncbi:MAG TPA: hypothetical protein VF849_01400 [Blattabacteriaceae bacterium]